MDHMAIIAKMQKRHEGKSERGGGFVRERVKYIHSVLVNTMEPR